MINFTKEERELAQWQRWFIVCSLSFIVLLSGCNRLTIEEKRHKIVSEMQGLEWFYNKMNLTMCNNTNQVERQIDCNIKGSEGRAISVQDRVYGYCYKCEDVR